MLESTGDCKPLTWRGWSWWAEEMLVCLFSSWAGGGWEGDGGKKGWNRCIYSTVVVLCGQWVRNQAVFQDFGPPTSPNLYNTNLPSVKTQGELLSYDWKMLCMVNSKWHLENICFTLSSPTTCKSFCKSLSVCQEHHPACVKTTFCKSRLWSVAITEWRH